MTRPGMIGGKQTGFSTYKQRTVNKYPMPDRINGARAQVQADQQVLIELLKHQARGADAVEHLQQRAQQPLLGRHQWPAS
jgi:hypothetical protein